MENQTRSSKIDISPAEDFPTGLSFEVHLKHGAEFDTLINNLSDQYKNSEVTVGVRFLLNNPENGEKVRDAVSGHVTNLRGQFPPLDQYLNNGASLDFRVAGNNLHADIHVSNQLFKLEDLRWDVVNQLDLKDKNYSGKYDFNLTSGFDPVKLLTESFDELLGSLLRFKIQGNGQTQQIQNLIHYVKGLLSQHTSKDFKKAAVALNLLTIARTMGFEFHYDVESLKSLVQEAVGHKLGDDQAKEMLQGYQGMANEFLPQAQAMAGFLLGPYAEELKAVNLGNYEVHVYVPRLRLYLNVTFAVPSLNGFLNEKFLQ
jgi:hypothetical protein